MQGGERWPQGQATKPSARLRAARAMPNWITARGSAVPPPPPPPPEESSSMEPEYEVIEFSTQQMYSNQPMIRGKEIRDRQKSRCDLCGSSAPAVKCMQCVQQNFCYSCDEMYHRHPKRQFHTRKELEGAGLPPLPPKGDPQPPPVPPPRRNKRATPRPQLSPQPPPPIPPSPQISQREPMSSKTGFMGSLKRMIGGRQLPIVPHIMDQQNQMPMNSSIMGFQDPMTNCNGCQDWSGLQRAPMSGSFNSLNHPGFGQMMQTQSMAHLNCLNCQRHAAWNPWGGMPSTGTWQNSAFLNRCPPKEEWSDSDSDPKWHRERQRRFSTISARMHRSHGFDDTQSMRGERRTDVESPSYKGSRRRDFETISSHGGSRKQHSDAMSTRGSRRSDLDNCSTRSQRKFSEVQNRKYTDNRSDWRLKDTESSDVDSDDNIIFRKSSRRIMSDIEDMRSTRKKSETIQSKQMNTQSRSVKGQTERNEKLIENRRKSSPFNNKYDSSLEENENRMKYKEETESDFDGKEINFTEVAKTEEEEDLGPIPDTEWECKHCTFVNPGGTRVCTVCCKTTAKPKLCKPPTSPSPPTEELKRKLIVEDKFQTETSKELKEKRGTPNSEQNRILTSKGTSPPPQSISTQTYEEGGRKLKRASSLADYGDWRAPQRSASRQSLLSDTQSLPLTEPPRSRSPEHKKFDMSRRPSDQSNQRNVKRAGSQPPEYISSLVQKQVKQGLEMVKLLREAEENQFSADDLAVALLHCDEGDPIKWLQENWRNMIDTVVTLGTNYGQERKENIVGTISASEAREALRAHDGNVWAAVTQCVEQRQRKYAELLSRGNFSREDIVTVLTANHGNLEDAYKELNKNQLKPFLMRIWGPPQGADNDEGNITKLAHGELDGRGRKNSEEVSVDLSIESNYDRIQNWLDHVNVNNKSKFSQSMLQLNLTGSNSSELELKYQINNKTNVSSLNHYASDVNNYLTNFYNANKNSLKIGNKNMYSSVQNLHSEVKLSSDPKVLYQDESKSKQTSHLTNSENIHDHLDNDIETITIKLKPVVVEIEDDSSDISESYQKENLNIEKKEIGFNNLTHNESNNSLEKNLDGRNDDKDIVLKSGSGCEKFSISSNESNLRLKFSRSNSETSSESFESLHSDSNEEEPIYQNMTSTYSGIHTCSSNNSENIEMIHIDIKKTIIENNGNLSHGNDKSINDINKNLLNKQPLKDTDEEINDAPIISPPIDDYQDNLLPLYEFSKNKKFPEGTLNTALENINMETENIEICSSDEDTKSSNNSHELVEEITPTVKHTPPIDEANESDNESTKSFKTFSRKILPEDKTSNNTTEIGINIEENISNSNPDLADDQIIFRLASSAGMDTDKINTEDGNSTGSLNTYEITDVNDEDINEYLEESGYNNEREKPSPITALDIKREGDYHIFEANSDKDVSLIQTDSEKEIHPNSTENNSSIEINYNSSTNNAFHSNQTELIDLLKKSLTKDAVVEKIVQTLFNSVLQVSNNARNLEELRFFQKPGNNENLLTGTEETLNKLLLTDTENISSGSNVFENGHELDIKQEIIIPKLILAEGEDTSQNINFEEKIENRPDNDFSNQNIFDEANEPKIISFQREARRLLAEGLVETYKQAEIALQLKDLNLDEDDGMILTAANDCDSLESAIAFLQQECLLCAGKCSVKQMISMLQCEHRCCLDCASNYFTMQITERSISDCICPFCKEPDILQLEEEKVLTYFSNLDILLKGLVKENIHELFQRKLRDRTLMQDPNFKWCVKCSSGYIANPTQKRLMCPDCKTITCAKCMKHWQKEHEQMSCDEFIAWLERNDPENQLARHLDENGVTCPNCKSKYILAKGGCMHLICPHCKHEFCSGCSKPFLMGKKCSVSEYCEKLGLHSHHPRNCLFYLRDKEPEELEKLLEDNKINYKNEESENLKKCNIQLLKEVPEGLIEGTCGYPTLKAGLCRTHYVESLVTAIRNNRVDPVMLLDYGEALQELKRHGKDPPTRPTGMSEYNHRQICLKVIADEIPLD